MTALRSMIFSIVLTVTLGVSCFADGTSPKSNQVSIGGAWLWPSWSLSVQAPFETDYISAQNSSAVYLGFNHVFSTGWALDTNYVRARMDVQGEQTRSSPPPYAWSVTRRYTSAVPVNMLNFCVQYHFRTGKALVPYIGLGANVMASEAPDTNQRGVQYLNHVMVITGDYTLGWVAQLGMNWQFTPSWRLKVEAEYVHNDVVMNYYRTGYRLVLFDGSKRIGINPVLAIVAIGFQF